ncbi:MFS transporter [Quadrisphaera sp. DSM 44207]|uniref:MFS transporter n=1 Tax=Quadrisphaera sp. DSM 44207 TaxID=1881057 RepID=UPI0008816D13|nr:MFS transporter [Quadrisphaera sp. DSM 44207]SDQ14876.1 Cyanate permease [Quadrisphaera sp. DSM 44207]
MPSSSAPSSGSSAAPAPSRRAVLAARTAVFAAFALNGFGFASWVSRLPETQEALALSPGRLGLLLLVGAVGSVAALPLAGGIAARVGPAATVAASAVLTTAGLAWAGVAAHLLHSPLLTGAGLLALGVGMGLWDVAMNLEGAAVERHLGRSIMPAFHAGFSSGTVAGAAGGALAAWLRVPVQVHLAVVAVLAATVVVVQARSFLPRAVGGAPSGGGAAHGGRGSALSAWTEGRTLLVGVLVLSAAFTEGTANDWLSIALVDGYGASPALGALGFAAFVTAMTIARLAGTRALDRWGRVPVLRATMLLSLAGVLVFVLGGSYAVAVVGALVWGAGASLGFPVGISAAADDPVRAAQRVSAVSTIGYTAFLAGPPLLGFLGDRVGVLSALLVVAAVAVPSLLVSRVAASPPAAERRERAAAPADA